MENHTANNMEQPEDKTNTADFFEWLSKTMESFIEGDHLHNGFYDPDTEPPKTMSEFRGTQTRYVEEALRFAGFSDDRPEKWPKKVVDVGCGLGGTSKYIAKKYGAKCQGITLSPYEAQRATSLSATQGLADKVSFQVADATKQPFPDAHFDLVLSFDCLEYVKEKKKFMSELARVAAPGGTIIVATFCRPEGSLQTSEEEYLKKISDLNHAAKEWYSVDDYVKLMEALHLQDIKTADWSQNIVPFQQIAFRELFTWRGLKFMSHGGLKLIIRSVDDLPFLSKDNKKGKPKCAIIACRKPK